MPCPSPPNPASLPEFCTAPPGPALPLRTPPPGAPRALTTPSSSSPAAAPSSRRSRPARARARASRCRRHTPATSKPTSAAFASRGAATSSSRRRRRTARRRRDWRASRRRSRGRRRTTCPPRSGGLSVRAGRGGAGEPKPPCCWLVLAGGAGSSRGIRCTAWLVLNLRRPLPAFWPGALAKRPAHWQAAARLPQATSPALARSPPGPPPQGVRRHHPPESLPPPRGGPRRLGAARAQRRRGGGGPAAGRRRGGNAGAAGADGGDGGPGPRQHGAWHFLVLNVPFSKRPGLLRGLPHCVEGGLLPRTRVHTARTSFLGLAPLQCAAPLTSRPPPLPYPPTARRPVGFRRRQR